MEVLSKSVLTVIFKSCDDDDYSNGAEDSCESQDYDCEPGDECWDMYELGDD